MSFPRLLFGPLALAFVLAASVAAASLLTRPVGAQHLSGEFDAEVSRLLKLERDPLLRRSFDRERTTLAALYGRHGPLWIRNGELTPQAREVLNSMANAGSYGLDAAEYRADELLGDAAGDRQNTRGQAERDLALSISALRFVSHLHGGRVDATAAGFDLPQRPSFDSGAAIERIAASANVQAVQAEIAAIEPPFVHYGLLKESLRKYKGLARGTPLPSIPSPGGVSAAAGDTYLGAPALRARLAAEGDLAVGAEHPVAGSEFQFDSELSAALKRFQFRYGIQADGVLGRVTHRALLVPLSARVRQIELTLERWRWLPSRPGPTIIVNIPQFRLFAFASEVDREEDMIAMDVIVGKTFSHTRTPAFAADMTHLFFRPYWDVPRGILTREMLPQAQRNGDYFSKEGLEVVDLQSGTIVPPPATSAVLRDLADGRARLRQPPGPANALGFVKFVLPNPHDVYLHSTPAKELFSHSRRAFSHGCIRVSDPVALAEYVLQAASREGTWSRERIEEAMSGSDNVRVDLARPIHVMIVYGTAVATNAKRTFFFEDLYGNDARLEKLLSQRVQTDR